MDFMMNIGGMKSAFVLVFQIPLPFFMLAFLGSLAEIIQEDYRKVYKNYLEHVVH